MTVGITGSGLLSGGLVGLCAKGDKTATVLLGSRFLRAISTRSYGMYVFHLVPLYVSFALLNRAQAVPDSTAAALGLTVGISLLVYGLAWLSWKYFEEPVLRLKKWEWFRKTPAADTGYSLQSEDNPS